ncbi:MAG: 1-acyl-sn-glycerol-3-phosphate acyltransferase [Planctomycetota bacterium]|nr:1-acyl-sn-glycerol-3-phosphate acyltransferase [Planctomycetota bacterium]
MRTFALAYPNSLVGTFYRRHVSGGPIPEKGGLVIYTNHVNGLMDADMPLYLTKRQQYFLAKPSLFKIPGISWVIQTVGAIPIYRQKDKVDMSKNEDSFREIHRVLRGGGAISLYPEGESRLAFRSRPFKTGAARMVLGAQEQNGDPIQLVPVALLYEEQEVFLCRVHLWVGEPFDLLPFIDSYQKDGRQAVRDATAHLQARLDELLVPVDDVDAFRVILNGDRILNDAVEGTGPRMRALALAWDSWAQREAGPAQALGQRLTAFGEQIERFGLEARDLGEGGLTRPLPSRLKYTGILIGAIAVSPFLAPPILLSSAIAHVGRSTPDKLVTVTTISASVLVPVWGIVLAYALARMETPIPGFWAILGCIWALLYVTRRVSLLWTKPRPLRRVLTGIGLFGRKQTMCDLWVKRQELRKELQTLFPDC